MSLGYKTGRRDSPTDFCTYWLTYKTFNLVNSCIRRVCLCVFRYH